MRGHFTEALLALAQGVLGLTAVLDFLPQLGIDPAQLGGARPDPRLEIFLGLLEGVFGSFAGDSTAARLPSRKRVSNCEASKSVRRRLKP